MDWSKTTEDGIMSEQELDKYSAKEYLPFQVKRQALFCQSSFRSSFELLATLNPVNQSAYPCIEKLQKLELSL